MLCALAAALPVELCELRLVVLLDATLPDVVLPLDEEAVPVDVTVPVVVTVPEVPVVVTVATVALVAEESAEEVTVTVLSVLSVVSAVVEAKSEAEETDPEVEALLGTALTGERITNWGVKLTESLSLSEVI